MKSSRKSLLNIPVLVLALAVYIMTGKSTTYYIPEIDMYVTLSVKWGRYPRAYFGSNPDVRSDYIEFKYYPDGNPLPVFLIQPNTFIVICNYYDAVIDICSEHYQFKKAEYNSNVRYNLAGASKKGLYSYLEYEENLVDSVLLSRPHYSFWLFPNSFTLRDNEGRLLINTAQQEGEYRQLLF